MIKHIRDGDIYILWYILYYMGFNKKYIYYKLYKRPLSLIPYRVLHLFDEKRAVRVVVRMPNGVRIVERRMATNEHTGCAQHPEQCRSRADQIQERSGAQRNESTAMRCRQRLPEQLHRLLGGAAHPDLGVRAGQQDDQQQRRGEAEQKECG